MTHIQVPVTDSLLAALRKAPHEVGPEILLAAAIHWYQQGIISMGRAAEAAGLDRPAFLSELARRRIDVFVVDEDDLTRELNHG